MHITVTKQIWVEHGHQGLSHTWTFINFSPTVDAPGFHFYTFITPVDEGHVRRFLVHARNVQLGEKMDKFILETNAKAEGEDRTVVGDLEPRHSPGDTTHEFLVEDDAIMARYRAAAARLGGMRLEDRPRPAARDREDHGLRHPESGTAHVEGLGARAGAAGGRGSAPGHARETAPVGLQPVGDQRTPSTPITRVTSAIE